MADPRQPQPGDGKSTSKTITDTVTGERHRLHQQASLVTEAQRIVTFVAGEHEHTIVGYSLIKGIGDGEPVASERFVVGGHEWVRDDDA